MVRFPLLLLFSLSLDAADTPVGFDSVCSVKAIRNVEETSEIRWNTSCRLEDMASPGYNNRFRVVFYGDHPPRFSLPEIADMVKVGVVGGAMTIRSVLWGEVVVTPLRETMKTRFRTAAYEIRPQRL